MIDESIDDLDDISLEEDLDDYSDMDEDKRGRSSSKSRFSKIITWFKKTLGSKKVIIALIVGIILVAGIAFGAWFFF